MIPSDIYLLSRTNMHANANNAGGLSEYNNYNLNQKTQAITEYVVSSKNFEFGLMNCVNTQVWLVCTSWYGYDLEYNSKMYSAPMRLLTVKNQSHLSIDLVLLMSIHYIYI